MAKSIEFILGDEFPWVYEAVIAIYGYSPCGSPNEGRESKLRKKTVNVFVTSLVKIWVQTFGLQNIAPHATVAKTIWVELKSHFNSVLLKDVPLMKKLTNV